MKARYIVWVLALFLAVGIFAPGKTWAQGGGGQCGGCACGGDWDGPGAPCFCNQCASTPGTSTLDCSNDGPTNQCGGVVLVCPGGMEFQCGPIQAGQGFFCSSNVFTCQQTFPSVQRAGEFCTAGHTCMQNCSCCPAGTIRACAGNTYTVSFSYPVGDTPDPNILYQCNSLNDEYLSNTTSGMIPDANGFHRDRTNTCRACGCVPVCSNAPPSAPSSPSPANGGTATNTVNLQWVHTNFGTACTGANNQYEIFVGTSPSSLALIGTVGGGTTSYPFTGTVGTTYYWTVQAKNGALGTYSPIWSFTIAPTVPGCSVTPPTGLTIVDGPTPGTTAEANWTPGIGGITQYIWVDEHRSEVEVTAQCSLPGNDCELSAELGVNDNSKQVIGLLPSTQYWFRIVNSGGGSCYQDIIRSFTTDSAAPVCSVTPPTGLTIVSGANPGTTAVVSWGGGGGGGTGVRLYVGTNQAAVNGGCVNPATCLAGYNPMTLGPSTTKTVSGLTPSTPYFFRVENFDGSCKAGVNGSYSTLANTGFISGKVYLDVDNTCAGTGLSGRTVTLDGTTPITTDANGNYSFTPLILNSFHTLAVSTAGYICSTASACSLYPCSLSGVQVSSTKNFYLTATREAWWQTQGAGVYSGATSGATIGSTIPSSATSPYLVLPAAGGTAAAVVRAGGQAPDLGSGSVNDDGWSAVSKYKGKKMNYTFFGAQMGLLASTPRLTTLNNKPGLTQSFYIKEGSSTVGGTWNVTSADPEYIIFVNGDLRINANITVANGGFLAFIVKGKITVDPAVTTLQGLYVMDDNFVTEKKASGNDAQLDMQGSVVAWGSVDLRRDLGNSNLSMPAEKFTYRPDLLTNMPEKMKSFVMQWSEVVAGSYQ